MNFSWEDFKLMSDTPSMFIKDLYYYLLRSKLVCLVKYSECDAIIVSVIIPITNK